MYCIIIDEQEISKIYIYSNNIGLLFSNDTEFYTQNDNVDKYEYLHLKLKLLFFFMSSKEFKVER
jgi:hypothetical protein